MIEKVNVTEIAALVHAAVTTVPGVAGFAKANEAESSEENVTMLLKDYSQSIKLRQDGRNFYIDIFLILLEGVNIKDIAREIQIRIKYELERLDVYSKDILIYVNVNIQDLLI
ncbi:Asp23/Gls24 family envelope stress response protein [Spiroplasma poulsonii]|uniref:Asp23/Gls24 family envelope stress response protein n=2 Tax=Spiroplasma TaxID=2132 RepID=A0A433EPM7_9MOLU|nr:Asp23/Gls24 family envelope stress response protein [Spiroplasma poulsonii]MBH8622654.1 Asp23/Gls24 family envelope stress response protein [Spiroplasma sp. hyd1]MBW3059154.1 Asp23/Gls24 family protein [Spiroplasma poulsonii]RUP76347.1 Asp23/Gls24 family envelope stress response protein [Spiroplasma poulsonii]UNF62467.1 Asp23/Gls24 family envelope stress response protein [Spiroplasma poulsonii]